MYVYCYCCDSFVYDFIDEKQFKAWRESLNYLIIFPYLVKQNDRFQFVQDAYDIDGNVIGTFTARVKLNRNEACNLLKNDKQKMKPNQQHYWQYTDQEIEAELVENKKTIFDSLEDARPGGFPPRSEIQKILSYVHGPDKPPGKWNEWKAQLEYWPRKIVELNRYDELDPVAYCRSVRAIEGFKRKRDRKKRRKAGGWGPPIADRK